MNSFHSTDPLQIELSLKSSVPLKNLIRYGNAKHFHTFVRAGHLFCFGSGVFYLAVVVKQECLLLLKKVIHFLYRKQTHRQR